jgi:alpha,alpha-trehalose-phosphate synthase [UDP-forming]
MPSPPGASFVVVANRLPVDRVTEEDGSVTWRRSPGGLVTALEPVIQRLAGTWIGWTGAPDEAPDPFDADGMHLVPVGLTAEEVARFYEGFSNATLWPLYHDVTAPPQFDRTWWEAYVRVNRRFAEGAATQAARRAVVWVQDYQLQLVPAMLRELRPDLKIGFFNHIPFPPWEIYARLPWRRQVVEGLLGADLVGFQRGDDARNFLRAVGETTGLATHGSTVEIATGGGPDGGTIRRLRAAAFPTSIDSTGLEELACTPAVRARAAQLREDLGRPAVMLLGVDRLDYTKGILHRLQAYRELLDEGEFLPPDSVLVQVASPSRERVEEYQRLRTEVEVSVSRINGEHASVGTPAVHYLHQSFPKEEMAALYLAADVMLVTPLRDGMNLVAKEYVACRSDEHGALVLSEFTGAADEMTQAFLVNPYDIDGTKDAIRAAAHLADHEAERRMRALRKQVFESDVHHWANTFLGSLDMVTAPLSDAPRT